MAFIGGIDRSQAASLTIADNDAAHLLRNLQNGVVSPRDQHTAQMMVNRILGAEPSPYDVGAHQEWDSMLTGAQAIQNQVLASLDNGGIVPDQIRNAAAGEARLLDQGRIQGQQNNMVRNAVAGAEIMQLSQLLRHGGCERYGYRNNFGSEMGYRMGFRQEERNFPREGRRENHAGGWNAFDPLRRR